MPVRSSQEVNGHHAGSPKICLPNPVSKRRTISMNRRKDPLGKDLEGSLSSALLVADKELGNVGGDRSMSWDQKLALHVQRVR
jgi:hypothetical protein